MSNSKKLHFDWLTPSNLFFFSLFLMCFALPWSRFLMSLSQFLMGIAWFWEGNYVPRIKRFLNNRAAIAIASIYFMHVIGIFWTEDMDFGMDELRRKSTIFVLPFVTVTGPQIKAIHKTRMLQVFSLMVVVMAFLAIGRYVLGNMGIHYEPITNLRELPIKLSHIRFALMCALTFYILLYLAFMKSLVPKWLAGIGMLIVLGYLFVGSSLTGIMALSISGMYTLIHFGKKWIPRLQWIGPVAILAGVGTLFVLVFNEYKYQTTVRDPHADKPLLQTASGNDYYNMDDNRMMENGYLTYWHLCDKELKEEWEKRSKIPFDGNDEKGQAIRYTIYRFLTSKGLYKDKEGMQQLNDDEIKAIEKGIANVDYLHISGLQKRLKQLVWQFVNYAHNGNPSGNSLVQRVEYWKTGVHIVSKHPLLGVGTGDSKIEYQKAYDELDSWLEEEWRLRAHNQYLTVTITLGFVGLLLFLSCLIYPLFGAPQARNFLYLAFALIIWTSMLNEDTLETQAGITLFALFQSILLFLPNIPGHETDGDH